LDLSQKMRVAVISRLTVGGAASRSLFIGGGQRVLRDLAGRFAGHLGDLADG
jgi:hypothetical protein